ncbi:hypothetical protein V8F33_000230 [Rhypophila sp. PSN 637]
MCPAAAGYEPPPDIYTLLMLSGNLAKPLAMRSMVYSSGPGSPTTELATVILFAIYRVFEEVAAVQARRPDPAEDMLTPILVVHNAAALDALFSALRTLASPSGWISSRAVVVGLVRIPATSMELEDLLDALQDECAARRGLKGRRGDHKDPRRECAPRLLGLIDDKVGHIEFKGPSNQ